MSTNTLNARLVIRNDILTNWNASALVLMKGEPALLVGADGTCAFYIGDGSKTFAQLSPSTMTPTEISNAITTAITNDAVNSVSITSGTNNGTIKLTVDGTDIDNIAVTGLGSAAFTEASAYATAAQGTLADNAMPKSGGTFTGSVTMDADPTENMHAATKQYVDTQISSSISASAAMVFKGTIGTSGTETALPTAGVVQGDTYKVIGASLDVPAAVSYTSAAVTAKVGDLIVAMRTIDTTNPTTLWLVVPSGDEEVTTVAYSTSNVTLSTTAQTGSVTFGEAAIKQVDTSIDAASTSVKLPTSAAVAAFVEGKGYTTTDENVKSTATTNEKIYVLGSTAAGQETAGVKKNVNVYVDTDGTLHATNGFVGNVTGNASTATALTSGINVSLTGGVTGQTAAPVNGGGTATVSVTSVNTDYLNNGTKDLVIDGGTADVS